MFGNGGFDDFAGYRYTILEAKIEECLSQIRQGVKNVRFDGSGLTHEETEYVIREVHRRAGG